MITATSYTTDKRNNIIPSTVVNHTTLSEAVELKKETPNDIMVFISADKAEKEAVQLFLSKQGLDIYPTKRADRYVMGLARRAQVACAIE
jgi:hypothetical protein